MKVTNCYMSDEQIEEQIDKFMYVRNKERKPIGVVLIDKTSHYGWSLYNQDYEEEMATTDKGLLIALSRATTFRKVQKDIGSRIMKMAEFRDPKNSRLLAVLDTFEILIKIILDERKRKKNVPAK